MVQSHPYQSANSGEIENEREGNTMKRTKHIELGNIDFKVCEPIHRNQITVKETTLYDCYGRYSEAKRRIWEAWKRDIYDIDPTAMIWVSSHNCNFFTISAIVTVGDKLYYMYITHTRQEVHEILYT